MQRTKKTDFFNLSIPKSKRTGLPNSFKMKHDRHFVDLISSISDGPNIRMIPIDKIDPNPHQARSELGKMNELVSSIKSKGILEPLLVRPKENRYEIIAGERRYVAAKKAGLKDIPCIEMKVKENEAMEIALIENLQRKDLNVFEEAEGLKALKDIHGYTHAQIATKIGKARSTITEIINIAKMPHHVKNLCQKYGIENRSMLIEIAKQNSEEKMINLINEIRERGLKRSDTRELSKKLKGKIKKIKHYVFNYVPEDSSFSLRIEFKKHNITKNEIIDALLEIIKKLKK